MGSRTPDDAGRTGRHVDWTNIELVSIPENDDGVESTPILAGLSANPSDLHDAFLSDLPHLQEIQIAHATHLATVGEEAETHYSMLTGVKTAEVAIATLGGFREGNALVLPLQGAIQDRVQLEIGSQGETTVLRLQAESEKGESFSQTFTLPAGCQLGQAGWRGNNLILELNQD